MKQGILITAYKEFHHLIKLINFFDDDFYLYIHIDKKSPITKDETEVIQKAKNVVFYSRQFNVNWAGINHLKSFLLLSREAMKNENIDYFHAISGLDFPTKSCSSIKRYLINNNGKEFLNCSEMPRKVWGDDGGMSKICYFNFYEFFNGHSRIGGNILHLLRKAQKKLKIKRNIPQNFPKLFGGSPWWTLSYPCLKYVVDYTKNNPCFLKRFKYTFGPTEIFFQTIIMNSHFKPNVINNDLRYIDWNNRNGSNPSNLDETDYDKIIKSDAIFARKFTYPVSERLVNKIEERITHRPVSFPKTRTDEK